MVQQSEGVNGSSVLNRFGTAYRFTVLPYKGEPTGEPILEPMADGSRAQGLRELGKLLYGLEANAAGLTKLMERIASAEAPEQLRDLLTEIGGRSLLEGKAC